ALYHQQNPISAEFLRTMEQDAAKFGLQLSWAPAQDAVQINQAIEGFAQMPGGGLIVLPSAITSTHRKLLVTLAARHRLPAVYPFGYYARDGGYVLLATLTASSRGKTRGICRSSRPTSSSCLST